MSHHIETAPPIDIDTMSKSVIYPMSCDWNGCNAMMNSWVALQKVWEFFNYNLLSIQCQFFFKNLPYGISYLD
jgi:hypothetical protein